MDTFKILKGTNSGLAMNLLFLKDELKLTTYEKILLVRHWTLSGRPSDKEPALMEVLGFDWFDYMNPFLIKLFDASLIHLLVDNEHYESLGAPEYKNILREIFKYKLETLEEDLAPQGYKIEDKMYKLSDLRHSLTLDITAPGRNYELFHFSANVEGYRFLPSIRLFNRPEDLTYLLTEQSITNLKGVMYYMTENPDWDKSLLPKSLKYLAFKSPVLDQLAEALVRKYYTKELESKYTPREEVDDSFGDVGTMPYDPFGDDDDD